MEIINDIIYYIYRMTTLISFKETIITLSNRFDKIWQYVFLITLLLLSIGIGICSFFYIYPVLYSICVFVIFIFFFNYLARFKMENIRANFITSQMLKIHEFAKKNTIWFLVIIISIFTLFALLDVYFEGVITLNLSILCMITLIFNEGFIETVNYIVFVKIFRFSLEQEIEVWKIMLSNILIFILFYIIGWLIRKYYIFSMVLLIAIVCSSNTIFLLNYLTPNYMKELDFDETETTAILERDIPIWGMLLYMVAFGSTLIWIGMYTIKKFDMKEKKDLEKKTLEKI